MKLRVGVEDMELGSSKLGELRDSNDLLSDREGLQARLKDDGYLLIRGLHGRDRVTRARKVFIDNLVELGAIAPDTDPMDAYVAEGKRGGGFAGGRKGVSHHPAVLDVLEGEPIMSFFSFLFGQPTLTFDYKWLRYVNPGEYTGTHYDVVYMGRGSIDNLYTCWTPMGDCKFEHGPLSLVLGSHNLPSFQRLRDTYGKMDVDRDKVQGWFSDRPSEVLDKFGGQFATTEFQAGDALIFGMFTMHGSVENTSKQFRISTDTRYQPANEPVDERWIGDNPIAHYGWHADPEKAISMADAKAQWGV